MDEQEAEAALAALALQEPTVRDLAWACFTPALLHLQQADLGTAAFPLTGGRSAWLQALDRDPAPLREWLQQRPATRLGVYFERLWQFFLHSDRDTELIASNLPVRSGGRTLGEFDCLYWCHQRQRAVHLELAVKFYLGLATAKPSAGYSNGCDWIGPNTVDRLDRKLQRLLQHQTQLSQQPAAQPVLAALHAEKPLREARVAGCLFSPSAAALPPPRGYNTALPLCRWLPLGEWRAECGGDWQIIPRLQWLAPLRASRHGQAGATLAATLEAHFREGGKPQLVAALDAHGNERSRCFVAADTWPDSRK